MAEHAEHVEHLEDIVVGSVALTSAALSTVAADLTMLQWRALVVVSRAPGGLRVGELAARIGAASSATSRLVGRLARRGLVATTPGARDRRVTTVALSRDGRRLVQQVVRARARGLRSIDVEPADVDALARLAEAFRAYG